MASIQEIKRRIKAVTNTRQITKAMEMVSATKMRRSQEIALLSRPYALEVLRLLGELSRRTEYQPQVMRSREVKARAILVVASDRGLAGSFNANVFRAFERRIEQIIGSPSTHSTVAQGGERNRTTGSSTGSQQAQGTYRNIENIYITVGRKAEEFITRKGYHPHASFKNFGDYVEADQIKPLADLLVSGFLGAKWDQVTVVSTHFRTTLRQDVVVRDVLPISEAKVQETLKELVPEYGRFAGMREENLPPAMQHSNVLKNIRIESGSFKETFEYLIEPDPKEVLDALAPDLVRIMVYDLVLEANASEHSARMVAMKNASENALELKDGLTLEYNKLRQAAITREVAEIVGGAEALRS